MTGYGHAHNLDAPRCACGGPIQATQAGVDMCAKCALVVEHASM